MKNAAIFCTALAAVLAPSACEPQDVNLSSLNLDDFNFSTFDVNELMSNANAALSSYQADLTSLLNNPTMVSSIMHEVSEWATKTTSPENHSSEEKSDTSGASFSRGTIISGLVAGASVVLTALV
ncbi:hypothetical protein LPJ72_001852 [Coemansia sp. Benny D160-2]|nr:hypothetical protein LPJ72_001852 [Coemansia sp. Benny D160-2]